MAATRSSTGQSQGTIAWAPLSTSSTSPRAVGFGVDHGDSRPTVAANARPRRRAGARSTRRSAGCSASNVGDPDPSSSECPLDRGRPQGTVTEHRDGGEHGLTDAPRMSRRQQG